MRRFLREQFARLRGSLGRRNFEREFDEEMASHLELLAQRFMRLGMATDEARYAARRQFGGMTQMKDEFRERSRLSILEAMLQDSAYFLRQLRRSPLFAIAAVLTLALGVGANTAIFTLVDQLLLRLLPIEDPQRLVALVEQGKHYGGNMGHNVLSYTMYQTVRDKNQAFSQMFCGRPARFTVTSGSQTDVLDGELASGNYFVALGVKAAAGRMFSAQDDLYSGAQPVAVIGYRYWQQRFAGSYRIIGHKILVNNYPLTVIGIAQPGFGGLDPGLPGQIFVPIRMTPELFKHDDFKEMFDPLLRWVNVYGRLRPGVTLAGAQAGLQPLFHQILNVEVTEAGFAHATPYDKEQFLKMWLQVIPGGQGNTTLRRQYERPLLVLMSVAGFVLLIACANLASLLTAKAAARQKEIAVRLAIGSSRGRIVQQLLTESLLLAVAGGLAGVGVAVLLVKELLAFLPDSTAGYTLASSPDARMLCFALGLSVVTGVIFGLVPAMQATNPNLAGVLKAQAASVAGGKAQIRLRKALVAGQITLSLVLLIGAGLFVRSLEHLRSLDPGFHTQSLMQFEVDLDSIGYGVEQARAFYSRLEARLRDLPGVRTVGNADNAVLSNGDWENSITVDGRANKPGENVDSYINAVSPGYFATLGIHLLAGRVFRESDTAASRKVVVVNESFARHYFGKEQAIGRRIGRGGDPGTVTDLEIVGVVNDTDYENLEQKAPRQVFLCAAQNDQFDATVYLSVAGDPKRIFGSVKQVVHEMEPKAPIMGMKTVEHQLEESLATERMIAFLSAGFSLLATTLSVLGLYGVMAYMVVQRSREIGIRMALGAMAGRVIWLVMREVVAVLAAGVAIALPLVFGLTRAVRSELYGVGPTDPVSIVFAIALLSLVALLAGYLPARRAASADPLRVLRYE